MYVITVSFLIKEPHIKHFLEAMHKQASDSMSLEDGCKQFDVCLSDENPNLIFLYEIYDNKEAFELHLKSDHFQSFSQKVESWVENKTVNSFSKEN